MREFVILEDTDGWNIRICLDNIVAYRGAPRGTIIMLSSKEQFLVRETVMDIDAILDKVGNKVYSIAELKESKGV